MKAFMDDNTKQIVAGIFTAAHYIAGEGIVSPATMVNPYCEFLRELTSSESEIDAAAWPEAVDVTGSDEG